MPQVLTIKRKKKKSKLAVYHIIAIICSLNPLPRPPHLLLGAGAEEARKGESPLPHGEGQSRTQPAPMLGSSLAPCSSPRYEGLPGALRGEEGSTWSRRTAGLRGLSSRDFAGRAPRSGCVGEGT